MLPQQKKKIKFTVQAVRRSMLTYRKKTGFNVKNVANGDMMSAPVRREVAALALLNLGLDTLNEEDWVILEKACDVMKLFEEVTVEMSSEKTVNISKVLLVTDELFQRVNTIGQDPDLPSLIKDMVEVMEEQLRARFSNAVTEIARTESTFLDPRFKSQGYPSGHCIKLSKYDDLMKLLPLIPPVYHDFYRNLKTVNDTSTGEKIEFIDGEAEFE
ncbi:hypothetical protein ANN_27884 [Periplaneta americana]|uniref:Uncharacterized protein n=1 Tax=Periplaneta americana TaxID=6978 RepID=A0ABQ8RVJ3_PERAM|nr:hypothetical protein ANN_27884 [Periplaneta americana]